MNVKIKTWFKVGFMGLIFYRYNDDNGNILIINFLFLILEGEGILFLIILKMIKE